MSEANTQHYKQEKLQDMNVEEAGSEIVVYQIELTNN